MHLHGVSIYKPMYVKAYKQPKILIPQAKGTYNITVKLQLNTPREMK
jgi:hypothetical protein